MILISGNVVLKSSRFCHFRCCWSWGHFSSPVKYCKAYCDFWPCYATFWRDHSPPGLGDKNLALGHQSKSQLSTKSCPVFLKNQIFVTRKKVPSAPRMIRNSLPWWPSLPRIPPPFSRTSCSRTWATGLTSRRASRTPAKRHKSRKWSDRTIRSESLSRVSDFLSFYEVLVASNQPQVGWSRTNMRLVRDFCSSHVYRVNYPLSHYEG